MVYVPVEAVKIEYRDNFVRDSVFLRDSISIRERGDTVFLEKYSYSYRDKFVRDSVYINDTIRVPYPVEVEKPVKYVSGWQNFQIWMGRILMVMICVFAGYWFIRK
jgi:hypothetical protein